MPNYLVLHIGTYTQADLNGGTWLGTSARRVDNVANESAAIDAAARSFGRGGRFVAMPMGSLVVGRMDATVNYPPVVLE
jgi:hypothetical protein